MPEETIELIAKVLCDVKPPQPTRAAYLFAQTKDNQCSVLERGAELLTRGETEMCSIICAGAIARRCRA